MSRPLCHGKPEDWWDSDSAGARLAMAICGRCTGCPDNDPNPAGVIRLGIPYSDAGNPLRVCEACGYPMLGAATGGFQGCGHCAVPPLSVFGADLDRWRAQGLTDREAGARVGATDRQVREFRRNRKRSLQAT